MKHITGAQSREKKLFQYPYLPKPPPNEERVIHLSWASVGPHSNRFQGPESPGAPLGMSEGRTIIPAS